MLVPDMLKEAHPSMKVGWFLHTPFPSSEIYRTLPLREEILKATLRADLIGFHTYDYARHFVSACTRILGLEARPHHLSPTPPPFYTSVSFHEDCYYLFKMALDECL
jgi:trehalose-6-phosphate synthase